MPAPATWSVFDQVCCILAKRSGKTLPHFRQKASHSFGVVEDCLSPPAPNPPETHSQRERRCKRTAAVHGLRLSLLLGLLVAWVYAEVNQAGVMAAGDQCTDVGRALGPTLKRKIRKSLGTTGGPNGQDSALSMKVCDQHWLPCSRRSEQNSLRRPSSVIWPNSSRAEMVT